MGNYTQDAEIALITIDGQDYWNIKMYSPVYPMVVLIQVESEKEFFPEWTLYKDSDGRWWQPQAQPGDKSLVKHKFKFCIRSKGYDDGLKYGTFEVSSLDENFDRNYDEVLPELIKELKDYVWRETDKIQYLYPAFIYQNLNNKYERIEGEINKKSLTYTTYATFQSHFNGKDFRSFFPERSKEKISKD